MVKKFDEYINEGLGLNSISKLNKLNEKFSLILTLYENDIIDSNFNLKPSFNLKTTNLILADKLNINEYFENKKEIENILINVKKLISSITEEIIDNL